MSKALLLVLGLYLLACYGYGVVVLVRLWAKRVVVRPTSKPDSPGLIKPSKHELEQDEQRLAA